MNFSFLEEHFNLNRPQHQLYAQSFPRELTRYIFQNSWRATRLHIISINLSERGTFLKRGGQIDTSLASSDGCVRRLSSLKCLYVWIPCNSLWYVCVRMCVRTDLELSGWQWDVICGSIPYRCQATEDMTVWGRGVCVCRMAEGGMVEMYTFLRRGVWWGWGDVSGSGGLWGWLSSTQ